jgi:hypothetical protein
MSITQKTHYNPCFWTALWNENYYSQISNNPDLKKRCRNQLIYSLNLKTDKVLHCKVENVHYENKLGISEIKPEDAKEYCRSVFPNSYDELCTYYDKNPNNLVLDFENVFSGVEDSPAYRSLMDVAINHGISTKEDKANLAAFIVMHNMRNHVIINSMVEMFEKIGRYRFEHFIWMKHAWSNSDILYSLVMPLLEGQWMLYKLRSHTFPLGDSPIMCKHGSIMEKQRNFGSGLLFCYFSDSLASWLGNHDSFILEHCTTLSCVVTTARPFFPMIRIVPASTCYCKRELNVSGIVSMHFV